MTKGQISVDGNRLRILLIQAENLTWSHARSYPYCLNFAFEDALRSIGVDVLMVTTPWFEQLDEICADREFDQVWINDLTHFCHIDGSLERIVQRAPIRIGLITESVEYHEHEYAAFPWLRERRSRMDAQYNYVTHIAAVDEADVAHIAAMVDLPTMWNPCSMPNRLVNAPHIPPAQTVALFSGSIYGERAQWLEEPALQELLVYQKSTNSGLAERVLFNLLHAPFRRPLRKLTNYFPFPPASLFPLYLDRLRQLRRTTANQWLVGMQQGGAVVNLPHLVKGYSSRVIEGLASGRPLISWRIPERPRNTAMFEDGKEILLFDTPEELATQIKRVLSDRDFAKRISDNGQQKVKRFHTTEQRVQQILHWVETGEEPLYGISQ